MKRRVRFFLALALCFASLLLSSCGEKPLNRYTYYGMGTYTTVSVEGGAPREVASILAQTERELSHRISDSVIAKANRGESVSLNEDLVETLLLCEALWQTTDGRFDVSVLPLSSLWNFDEAPTGAPSASDIASALERHRREGSFPSADLSVLREREERIPLGSEILFPPTPPI